MSDSNDWRPRLADDQREQFEQFKKREEEPAKQTMDRVLRMAKAWQERESDVL
jgi:hypothetical protein